MGLLVALAVVLDVVLLMDKLLAFVAVLVEALALVAAMLLGLIVVLVAAMLLVCLLLWRAQALSKSCPGSRDSYHIRRIFGQHRRV